MWRCGPPLGQSGLTHTVDLSPTVVVTLECIAIQRERERERERERGGVWGRGYTGYMHS